MTPTQVIGLMVVFSVVGWNAYEAFRMRQHRAKTNHILHLVTVVLEKLEKRQDAALAHDQTIGRTLEAIESRLSRHATPPNE